MERNNTFISGMCSQWMRNIQSRSIKPERYTQHAVKPIRSADISGQYETTTAELKTISGVHKSDRNLSCTCMCSVSKIHRTVGDKKLTIRQLTFSWTCSWRGCHSETYIRASVRLQLNNTRKRWYSCRAMRPQTGYWGMVYAVSRGACS
jgi:hypothetical protein